MRWGAVYRLILVFIGFFGPLIELFSVSECFDLGLVHQQRGRRKRLLIHQTNKTMNKLRISLAAAFVMLVSVMVAQPGGGRGQQMSPEDRAAKQTSSMVGELDLDADQAAKVEEINLRYGKEQQTFREENRGNRETMMAGMKALMEKKDAELKAILTPEQYAKHEKMQAEQRAKMQEGGQGGGRQGGGRQGGGRPDGSN